MKTACRYLLGAAPIFAGTLAVAGCNRQYPGEKPFGQNAMSTDNLNCVSVSQDRAKGVMKLSGSLASGSDLAQAPKVVNEIEAKPARLSTASL